MKSRLNTGDKMINSAHYSLQGWTQHWLACDHSAVVLDDCCKRAALCFHLAIECDHTRLACDTFHCNISSSLTEPQTAISNTRNTAHSAFPYSETGQWELNSTRASWIIPRIPVVGAGIIFVGRVKGHVTFGVVHEHMTERLLSHQLQTSNTNNIQPQADH